MKAHPQGLTGLQRSDLLRFEYLVLRNGLLNLWKDLFIQGLDLPSSDISHVVLNLEADQVLNLDHLLASFLESGGSLHELLLLLIYPVTRG